jgi:hypothetical protein
MCVCVESVQTVRAIGQVLIEIEIDRGGEEKREGRGADAPQTKHYSALLCSAVQYNAMQCTLYQLLVNHHLSHCFSSSFPNTQTDGQTGSRVGRDMFSGSCYMIAVPCKAILTHLRFLAVRFLVIRFRTTRFLAHKAMLHSQEKKDKKRTRRWSKEV